VLFLLVYHYLFRELAASDIFLSCPYLDRSSRFHTYDFCTPTDVYLRFPSLHFQSLHFYLLSTKITLNRLHTWTRDSLMFLYVVCLFAFGKCHFSCRISLRVSNFLELSKLIFKVPVGGTQLTEGPEMITLTQELHIL